MFLSSLSIGRAERHTSQNHVYGMMGRPMIGMKAQGKGDRQALFGPF
jgi:hypothetical protein